MKVFNYFLYAHIWFIVKVSVQRNSERSVFSKVFVLCNSEGNQHYGDLNWR